MYPGHWTSRTPDRTAVIDAVTGNRLTYAELDQRSSALAHVLHAAGLRRGDHVALFMTNRVEYSEVSWAALRSGLYLTPVNRHLTAAEALYIIENCRAAAVLVSADVGTAAAVVARLPAGMPVFGIGGGPAGTRDYEAELAAAPSGPSVEQPLGDFMFYSSGTTGRPKGIARPLADAEVTRGLGINRLLGSVFGFGEDTTYLSTAPLYHSVALGFATATQGLGGTVVMLPEFDAEVALSALTSFQVTHSQWVPTMFSRLLALPPELREAADLTHHRVAVHGAAPCPRSVKQAMLDWWGPKLYEYYGGTEMAGLTVARPEAWLAHPGTVGRPVVGEIHICDDDGVELPPGETGLVYFGSGQPSFQYFGDMQQTQEARHADHASWSTMGDVGKLDDEGFLYLSDRATFMIISGGVNIYPQEVADCLVEHPAVVDAAVFGVPNPDLGEEVKAVVQLDGEVGLASEEELIAYCRQRLAAYKCPRSVDFARELPRTATGKLAKRTLRDPYWKGYTTRIG